MIEPDYIYIFDDITEERVSVIVQGPSLSNSIEETIIVRDRTLLQRQSKQLSSVTADLLDIAIAVHIADRILFHKQENIPCKLLRVPLRNPEIFHSSEVMDKLTHCLHWFTEDIWLFEFSRRKKLGRVAEQQLSFDLVQPTEVALWSGGLDALAGLYNRLSEQSASQYSLVSSTNGNRYIHGVQRKVYQEINNLYNNITLTQISLRVCKKQRSIKRNFVPRTRGFVFMLFGIVMADIEGQNRFYIYENGIGAINLPFRESSMAYHQSRAVHPISIYHMSNLASEIFKKKFIITNPFIFYTKAEIIEKLVNQESTELVAQTISCDRRYRYQITQCGRCSSCLLRRQALGVHNLYTEKYAIPIKRQQGRPLKKSDGDYFRAMLYQVNRLSRILNSKHPWVDLSAEFPELSTIARWRSQNESTSLIYEQEQLIRLYSKYVEEWKTLELKEQLAQGLIPESEFQALAI
jgi:7-cyano-7-deazaguanine synthase in queuosine biosynthesis